MATVYLYFFFLLFGTAQSIRFKLAPDTRKCIKDEVHKDVLVLGQYDLSEAPMQKTDILVSDHVRRIRTPVTNSKGTLWEYVRAFS